MATTVVPVLILAAALAAGQSPAAMRARLSTVPIDVAMQATVAGSGSATATLPGTTLSVEGTYRGLVTPATTVRVYESPRAGMRGTLVGEFQSGGGTSGVFAGVVALTPDRAAAFGKGLLYVQIQSEKAPDGNLWGWLLPAKGPRR
ncbi:MAG: CHRD domain-containing protein [Vicinamibacterales bacterium]